MDSIVYKKGINYDQIEPFSNSTFYPYKEGEAFTHESGVCETGGQILADYPIETIWFCQNVTDEQKEKLREILKNSDIVYKFYENKTVEDVEKTPKQK